MKKRCSFPYSKDGRKHTWQFISKLSASSRSLKFGLRTFFRMKAFLLTQLYAQYVRFCQLAVFALVNIGCSPLSLSLSCATRKQSTRKKWPRELQGFRSTRQEGSKSRNTICYLCESRIPKLWKHEIPLPLVILIPASRPSFELKCRISRRKNAESGRIPPNLLGTLWNRKCASFSLLRILITRLHLKFLPMKLRKNYKNIAFRGGPAATALLWLIVYE